MTQLAMGLTARRFVYVNKPFEVDGTLVREYEVGIVQRESEDACPVLIVRINKQVQLPRSDFVYFDVTRVGDAFPKKVCNVCQRYLDTSQFQLNQNGKGDRPVRRPSCNACREIIDGVATNFRERREWELRRPHLVPFKCPICGKVTVPGLTSKIVLDHDHNTGRIRGWICDSCNTGIGRFKDDIDLLKRAIKYLEDQES